jgi:hypothetical protein
MSVIGCLILSVTLQISERQGNMRLISWILFKKELFCSIIFYHLSEEKNKTSIIQYEHLFIFVTISNDS